MRKDLTVFHAWAGLIRARKRGTLAPGLRVFWSDLHKTGGLWSLWFVLVIGVTGIWYFIEAAGVDMNYPQVARFEKTSAAASLSVDELLRRAHTAWPEFEVRVVRLQGGFFGHTFALEGQAGDVLVRDRANKLLLDPVSGEVQLRQRAADLTLAARWVDTADPVHFGDFAGLAVKVVWFVFGLLLSGLSLTGTYLHVQRLRRKHRGANRRPAVIVAYAVSALVLGASVAGGWAEIHKYGPVVDGVPRWPEVPLQVVAFIGAWVALTMAILAIWIRKLR